ncbi:RAD51-like protein 1 [Drosophila mojavensis]|uniref:RecA family profile 1 domain-containing protein n=1 Tax=Drosophila mojavensis TaxID=7230 RepID=B4KQK9_DROMO|nr:RAD51-like protein 1 [Drosophila mojavensis]EDW08178.1 uncharacterized protein Dmoj_GI19717 [Drosophila mojavensis]
MEDHGDLQSLLLATKTGKEISEYHIKLLQKQNIRTVEEFVHADKLHTRLALSNDKTEQIKREILDLCVRRIKFKTIYKCEPISYSTGIEELDNLLDAIGQPLRPGRVWELVGENDVGKTELLHTLAVNFVCKQDDNQQVLFVDTNLDFDSERLDEILRKKQLTDEAIDNYLDRISVAKACTAEALLAALQELLRRLTSSKGSSESVSDIKLILIDSLTACYILYRSSYDRNKGRSFLTELTVVIRKLAVEHSIAFIIGNAIFSLDEESAADDDEEELSHIGAVNPEDCNYLGDYWSSVCTLILSLELPEDSVQENDLRVLKVLSNSFGIGEGSCWLRLTDAGII